MSNPPNSPLLELSQLLKAMAARPEYHFPIVAAQRQFRERYYGLLSAAMLEDLFLDAAAHFVSTSRPDAKLLRPPRGEKGWDYSFDGLQMSHKVSKSGAQVIAVLWDATRTDLKTYTYPSPISLTTGGYSPGQITIQIAGQKPIRSQAITWDHEVASGGSLVLLRWNEDTTGEVLYVWNTASNGKIQDVLSFHSIWAEIARASTRGIPANHIELVALKKINELLTPGTQVALQNSSRAGTYLIPKESLADIPVTTNNRGVLIDKKLIAELMTQAVSDGLFIPMPIWFAAYAGNKPPDLYLAQKRNYDDFFTSGSS